MSSGQKFSVVVKLINPSSGNYPYPIAVEYPVSDYSSSATASSGQSYFSPDGTSWTDLTTLTNSYYGDNYAIGSVSGSANFLDWTNNGTALSVTKTGLSLVDGTTYYFRVKAVNGFGLYSTAAWSNGQYVDITSPEYIPYI